MEQQFIFHQKSLIDDLIKNDNKSSVSIVFSNPNIKTINFKTHFITNILYPLCLPKEYQEKTIDYVLKSQHISKLSLDVNYNADVSGINLFSKIISKISKNKNICVLNIKADDNSLNYLTVNPKIIHNSFIQISKLKKLKEIIISGNFFAYQISCDIITKIIKYNCGFKNIKSFTLHNSSPPLTNVAILQKLYLRNLLLPYIEINVDYITKKYNLPQEISDIILNYLLVIE